MTLPRLICPPGTLQPDDSGTGFSPIRLMEVELTEPLPSIAWDGRYSKVWIVARLHTEPIGECLIQFGRDGLTPTQLGTLLSAELHAPVSQRFAAARLPAPAGIDSAGLKADPQTWPFLCGRRALLAEAPLISVVIPTRDRPDQLARCLAYLNCQEYPRFEVIVVENVPTDDSVRELVAAQDGHIPYRYLAEPRSGVNWARNTGIAGAAGTLIAFLDDDGKPDSHWLEGLALGFARSEKVGCVTGIVLPAVLDTPAQELFERLGGHSKGRAFERITFSRSGPQSPFFPLPPFGVGANMAFRKETLAKMGGLDVALGVGTPSLAGSETLALSMTLLSGYDIAYEPAALVWHHHRGDIDSLRSQLYGYSVGLTAFYAALIRNRPSVIPHLLTVLPHAARYLWSSAKKNSAGTSELLAALDRRHGRGMLLGPVAYARSVRQQARVRRAFMNS